MRLMKIYQRSLFTQASRLKKRIKKKIKNKVKTKTKKSNLTNRRKSKLNKVYDMSPLIGN